MADETVLQRNGTASVLFTADEEDGHNTAANSWRASEIPAVGNGRLGKDGGEVDVDPIRRKDFPHR